MEDNKKQVFDVVCLSLALIQRGFFPGQDAKAVVMASEFLNQYKNQLKQEIDDAASKEDKTSN